MDIVDPAIDLYLHELALSWCERAPALRYTPVLSEPAPDTAWDGETGWVHDSVIRHYPDLGAREVYASGPPPMIEAAKLAFASHGLDPDRLYFDSFELASDSITFKPDRSQP